MQKYATANNLKIKKCGKGITKLKLLQSILKNMKHISNDTQNTPKKNETQVLKAAYTKTKTKKQNKLEEDSKCATDNPRIREIYEELRATSHTFEGKYFNKQMMH